MKKKLLPTLLLLFSLAALGACKEKGIYTTFNTEYEFEARIPATTGIALPIELFTTERHSDFASQYSINDTRKDLVSDVELTQLVAEVTNPPNEDFSFLSAIAFFISADQQSELKIAEKSPVPANVGSTLAMDVFPENLAPYIKNDTFTVRMTAETDETLSQDITVVGRATFRIRAKVIGK